ncbi:MAG: class I SAM-dependent methyltransferase [Acidobacteriota bacterium]
MVSRDHIDVERRRGEQLPFGMHSRDEAVNYFAWQASLFAGIARGRIVDHGAGTGGLANALLELGASDIVAVEPNAELCDVMDRRFAGRPIAVFRGTLDDYLAAHGGACVDCIVSSNVIEHVEHDVDCLRAMHEALRPGGAVGIYVPARPELFGSLDRAVGHYRRYTRDGLDRALRDAGFDVRSLHYCNLIGILPWLVAGRVLKRERVGAGGVRAFDRYVFPVFRRLEEAVTLPYGLNLAAIGVKR